MIAISELPANFLTTLASAAIRGLAIAAVAGLTLAVLRVKATSIRLFTWTAVLYVALGMPVLQLLLPPLAVPMQGFLRTPAQHSVISQYNLHFRNSAFPSDPVPKVTTESESVARSWRVEISWTSAATAAYLAVLMILSVRIIVGLLLERRLRRASRNIADERITSRIAHSARAHGLSFVVLAENDLISVPLTLGILRPILLFPATWRDWDDVRLDAVIAHEMSHVARRDSLTQRLALLHRAIFWFNPLSWWLVRHLADLAERASDESALAWGIDRTAYARTLLNFFESLQTTRGRVRWQGISMASAGRAEQRVERILNWKGTIPMRFKTLITALIVLLAIPVVYLTASAQPYDRNTESPRPAGVEIAQNTQPPASAPASHSTHASHKSSRGTFYSYSDDNDQRFVIVSGNDDSLTMSGMGKDSEHVQELRKSIGGDFIWFRRGGKYYVIRDQSTVQRAQSFWAPQSELGKKQEELGRQQEELGKQQEELGRQMEQTRVAVPDLSKELERLQAQLKQLGSSATVSQIGDIQSQIGELQSKFGESQSHAGESQSKLGEQMGALGEKQGKLGEQQGKLGEQQGKLAEEATHKMKALLDEAIKNGAAQPEN